MKLTLKLYAGLSRYLPPDAVNNSIPLDVEETITPNDIIRKYDLPFDSVHIVLLNGIYLNPEERDQPVLKEEDTLAMWPPVAGG